MIPETLLSALSEVLSAAMGLHFPRERWRDLERGIAAACRESGCADAEVCVRRLLSAPMSARQIETLASHLTVGETYFFRDPPAFEALEAHVLPELLRARGRSGRRIRIWSAGCCTGEEPYSIAMLLHRMLGESCERDVSILATDINPGYLAKAEKGIFGEWSFRAAPEWVRQRFFTRRKDRRFEIRPEIRRLVTFAYFNLVQDAFPSLSSNTTAMDVVFCRNVLMYFEPERAKRVIEGLRRSLVDDGWLFVSPADAPHDLFRSLARVDFPGTCAYRNTGTAEPGIFFAADRAPAGVADAAFMRAAPATPAEPFAAPPLEPLPAHQRARRCANEGRLDEALAWCEQAIGADHLAPEHYYLHATIQLERGDKEAAARSLERALYLDPAFVMAYFTLGNLRAGEGRRRDTTRLFGNALELVERRPREEIVPESDGLTAGRLGDIIMTLRPDLQRATTEARSGVAA